jgi:hypothetical protein
VRVLECRNFFCGGRKAGRLCSRWGQPKMCAPAVSENQKP